MTSRIESCFRQLDQDNRSALVTYITAGDPLPEATLVYMQALSEAGADIIELGMPFSDPMADGPVIQRASERALSAGMTLAKVLSVVREFRAEDKVTPIILMGYLNPIEAMGYQVFATQAAAAGVDGVLIVDMPPEESADLNVVLKDSELDQIFLISPNSSESRIASVSVLGGGFAYYVTIKGVTGSAALDVSQVAEKIGAFRSHVSLPIGVGFGIKTPEQATAVARFSDAVIIGSALVEIVEQQAGDIAGGCQQLSTKVRAFREAINHARQ